MNNLNLFYLLNNNIKTKILINHISLKIKIMYSGYWTNCRCTRIFNWIKIILSKNKITS